MRIDQHVARLVSTNIHQGISCKFVELGPDEQQAVAVTEGITTLSWALISFESV